MLRRKAYRSLFNYIFNSKYIYNSRLAHSYTSPTLPPTADDSALVSFFDQPNNQFNGFPTGLFTHTSLTTASAFHLLSRGALLRAQALTDKIVRAPQSRHDLALVIKNLDKLSDLLCGVIDLAELIRNAHPDQDWVQSANEAYETLCEFMNVLNTHVGLFKTLEAVFSDATLMQSLSQEAYYSALIFLRDFQKSAINLPSEQRNRFVSLSSEISVLGRQFLDEAKASRAPVFIESSELSDLKDKGMGVRLRLQARFTNRKLLVYPNSLQAQMIMRSAPAEEPRRRLYISANASPPEHIETLERLLRARAELAKLVGSESYAHMALDDKMARSPENVEHFLDALISRVRSPARQALLTLSQRKQAHLDLPTLPIIQAWDREYYCPPEPPAPPIPLPPLTPGVVFMGLSRLFRHLYGISFRPVDVAPGEVWHQDVRKLEVVDEDAGIIGWIYTDLFARRGKASGAAHYTVRCSRRVDDDDLSSAQQEQSGDETVQRSLEFDTTHLRRLRGSDGLYQLPVVALVCEFTPPSARRGAAPLEWHEVQTLFHEMGHAMHSMIGRTDYQSVAGTRCATDFVELPSILMEHFLNSPSILSLFDPNATSYTPVLRPGNHHEDPCHYIDTYTQIMIAWLDQLYHSKDASSSSFNTTSILANLQDTKGIIPSVPGTSWQTQFGHLYGYGATYYSYLFDRVIASRVWTSLFSHDALNRETGEKFKREILRHGGGKDPWKMVSGLLSLPELESGDAKAMEAVGHWTIEEGHALPTRH